MRDLTQHLTTRADDNHAPPVSLVASGTSLHLRRGCQGLVRYHMLHRLCGSPSIPLSFSLATVVLRWSAYCVYCGTDTCVPTPSTHRLQRGLPGYLILFAPHAFVPQRLLQSSKPPSPLVFFQISTHFTATLGIPLTSPAL